jgi:type I restriction enzyme M protein
MTVIRRVDAVLEPTKDDVLKMEKQLDEAGISNKDVALYQASKQPFYNTSPFTLKDLKARAKQQQLRTDFEAYLDGFSQNIQEILDKFKFRNQIQTLIDADVLSQLIEKFLNPDVNLSPKPVYDVNGNERLPALDNHAMGTIFEELIRRFNEENNEEAGEHFTPRDVVKLMADLILLPIADKIKSGTYLLYDGACGTGGMLTVAEERLAELAEQHGKQASIYLYGQEINAETFAITKADLLLKGEGSQANNIVFGSTLSADGYPSREFDFMLSNPPYGKSWKTDLERMGGKNDLTDPRFLIKHGDDPEFSLITRSSDGQLMFLVSKLSKMKKDSPLGSRIVEVHNGSSLFTGDAGSGESNIRRWIIENDWLEAIVALPLNMFYNTGIATYIWVLTNRKPEHRKGKVQLIDATQWYKPLRKNMGNKNCELGTEDIERVWQTFNDFEETEQSKIFPNSAFGYYKITVEQPLRLKVDLSYEKRQEFRKACEKSKDERLADVVDRLADSLGSGSHDDWNAFLSQTELDADSVKLSAKHKKMLMDALTIKDENAKPIIKNIYKSGRTEPDPVYGRFTVQIDGKPCVVEYEPDADLRDTEQVPLLEEGGIEGFFRREVLPHVPDAWIDESKTVIGYEVSFTRYFYKLPELRTLDEITADIRSLEAETEGLLEQIIGEGE